MLSSFTQDMAELSKTSTISVFFNICLVLIIAIVSPFQEAVEDSGGILKVVENSSLHPRTLFVGFGVLSFAFVSQDASFIIAGSLDNPTKEKWGKVTRSSLLTSFMLAATIGVTGYLGFQEETKGNILNSFHYTGPFLQRQSIFTQRAIFVSRVLLGSTMFCVYPLASYIARHVLIVLLFSGTQAHEGDDHIVLARIDRRVVLTLSLYIAALPAFLCEDLGLVLGLTGAIGGSCLSYVGPGAAYLAIYSEDFISATRKKWGFMRNLNSLMWKCPSKFVEGCDTEVELIDMREDAYGPLVSLIYLGGWYMLFMPLWCTIASIGYQNYQEYKRANALTLADTRCQIRLEENIHQTSKNENDLNVTMPLLAPLPNRNRRTLSCSYNAVGACNSQTKGTSILVESKGIEPNIDAPSLSDFMLAIALIILGGVALTAGIFSISMS